MVYKYLHGEEISVCRQLFSKGEKTHPEIQGLEAEATQIHTRNKAHIFK